MSVLVLAGAFIAVSLPGEKSAMAGTPVTVYKSSSCGCCGNYVQYLEGRGFDVTVVETEDRSALHEGYGIPSSLMSCHTSVVEGYAVEGHIPSEVIDRLLAERPDIAGIALAGMPSGSPGMPGAKTASFPVHKMDRSGGDGGIYINF